MVIMIYNNERNDKHYINGGNGVMIICQCYAYKMSYVNQIAYSKCFESILS